MLVLSERNSTWFTDTFTTSAAERPPAASRRSFSLIRSNTTIVSYSE